jgi:hypothetical protein
MKKLEVIYKEVERIPVEDKVIIKCLSKEGITFYLEDDSLIENYIKDIKAFKKTIKLSRTEILNMILEDKPMFYLSFIKENGDERELGGFLIKQSPVGYLECLDCEINEPRNVNPQTIKWCIINNIKYIVK